jgi:ubiquinone/menaquinone biosynthesis C-methylase UbiE
MSDSYLHGYTSDEQERLLRQAEHWREELILDGTVLVAGTRLLEIGCGVGGVLGILGLAFPGIVLNGVDIEERQLETARQHLKSLGLEAELRRANALALPHKDGSFDHVWMMWFLEHVDDPIAALREARRVLVPGGMLTAIEVDYNTLWASLTSDAFAALAAAVAKAMDATGRSDAGTRIPEWLEQAGFSKVDAGERRLVYRGRGVARQVPYIASVIRSTLPELTATPNASTSQLAKGLAELLALPNTADAALGWTVHKAHAVR